MARVSDSLRVFQDGDLTFGVRAGRYYNGDTAVAYAGASAQAVVDDAVNYIYLTAAGVLTVNQTGFPALATTAHLPLAVISTGTESGGEVSGKYAYTDITDYRSRAFLAPVGVLDSRRALSITAAAEGANARRVSIQATGPSGASLSGYFRVRLWIATSNYGAPSAADNTFGLVAGTQLRALTADADYEIISTSAGLVQFDLTIAGAATRYILAEFDGRIYSSGALSWSA